MLESRKITTLIWESVGRKYTKEHSQLQQYTFSSMHSLCLTEEGLHCHLQLPVYQLAYAVVFLQASAALS